VTTEITEILPSEAELLVREVRTLDAEPDDLPTWYLGEMCQLDALADRIKRQADVLLAQVERRRAAIQWKYGPAFHAAVDERLEGSKKRSVDFATGRAGYRKSVLSLDVVDKEAAVAWATEHCPLAVKFDVSRTELKKHLKATGERPDGVEVNPAGEDRFYPATAPKRLPDGFTLALEGSEEVEP
jgi:phage host-nuclease inhibitor protein Gam